MTNSDNPNTSKPGLVTKPDNIPEELKAIPNWVLYETKSSGNKLTKVPRSARNPSVPCSIMDRANFATFDAACDTMRSFDDGKYGLGLVLTEDLHICCFDFDDKGDPESYAKGLELFGKLNDAAPSYGQQSVSGKGYHWFIFGDLPHGRGSLLNREASLEVWHHDRFIAMTGNLLPQCRKHLADGQPILDELFATVQTPAASTAAPSLGAEITPAIAQPYLDQACARRSNLAERMHTPMPQGGWGKEALNIMRDLAAVGTPEDVAYLIMAHVPFTTQSAPSSSGEDRSDKLARLFFEVRRYGKAWADMADERARYEAAGGITPTEHGRDMSEQFTDKWETGQAKPGHIFEMVDGKVVEVPITPTGPASGTGSGDAGAGTFSDDVSNTGDVARIPAIGQGVGASNGNADAITGTGVVGGEDESVDRATVSRVETLVDEVATYLLCGTSLNTPPNAQLERLIDINTRAMKKPFRKFAEVSTIAAFGGSLARKYKSDDGLSTATNEMLIAPTGSGKGEAFQFWPSMFILSHPFSKNCFVNGEHSSAQILHRDLQQSGVLTRVQEECASSLRRLCQPKSETHETYRGYELKLFDASRNGKPPLDPAKSISGSKREDSSIPNACCSSMWSTTDSEFRSIYTLSILSTGYGSRQNITLHHGPSGDLVPDANVLGTVPDDVKLLLQQIMTYNEDLYHAYKIDGAPPPELVIVRKTQSAQDLIWRIEQAQSACHRGVDGHKLPPYFAVFLRTAMNAKKYALLSAIIRNPTAPIIDVADVQWGVSRVVRLCREIVLGFETGELGDSDDAARRTALVSWFKTFATGGVSDRRVTQAMLSERKIPFWWLTQRAQRNNSFKNHPYGADAALLKTLKTLQFDGVCKLEETSRGHVVQLFDI